MSHTMRRLLCDCYTVPALNSKLKQAPEEHRKASAVSGDCTTDANMHRHPCRVHSYAMEEPVPPSDHRLMHEKDRNGTHEGVFRC